MEVVGPRALGPWASKSPKQTSMKVRETTSIGLRLRVHGCSGIASCADSVLLCSFQETFVHKRGQEDHQVRPHSTNGGGDTEKESTINNYPSKEP